MSNVVDFHKLVRQAAMYGAAMKQLPLQVTPPDSMDIAEQAAFSAAVNSIFAHMKALKAAGVDPASVGMAAIASSAVFAKLHCPDSLRPKYVEVCVDNFRALVANTQIQEKDE